MSVALLAFGGFGIVIQAMGSPARIVFGGLTRKFSSALRWFRSTEAIASSVASWEMPHMAGRENLVGESIASVALAALSALTTNRRHGPCRRWTRRFRPTGLRPQLEVLERIRLLTIWTVNSMGYVGAKGQEDWSQVYPSLKPGDTVKFDIVAGQVWVDPNDPNVTYTDPDGPYVLPPESDVFQGSITLNGTTQPHFQPGQPQIYFENTNNPVTIEGGNSTIEGLGFADDITLELTNLGGDTVQDCVFGIDPSNGQPDGAGLQILCNNNTIGGIAANAGNVFAGASPIDLNDAMGNLIEGNWLGTDKSGTFEQGTDENGINILNGSSNNTIGGTTAGAGNVIAYNQQNGVAIYLPPAGRVRLSAPATPSWATRSSATETSASTWATH